MGSDTLCRHLGVGALPMWVTNLATAGVSIRDGARNCTKACLPCAPAVNGCLGKSDDLHGKMPFSLSVDTPVLLPVESEGGGSITTQLVSSFNADPNDSPQDDP